MSGFFDSRDVASRSSGVARVADFARTVGAHVAASGAGVALCLAPPAALFAANGAGVALGCACVTASAAFLVHVSLLPQRSLLLSALELHLGALCLATSVVLFASCGAKVALG